MPCHLSIGEAAMLLGMLLPKKVQRQSLSLRRRESRVVQQKLDTRVTLRVLSLYFSLHFFLSLTLPLSLSPPRVFHK